MRCAQFPSIFVSKAGHSFGKLKCGITVGITFEETRPRTGQATSLLFHRRVTNRPLPIPNMASSSSKSNTLAPEIASAVVSVGKTAHAKDPKANYVYGTAGFRMKLVDISRPSEAEFTPHRRFIELMEQYFGRLAIAFLRAALILATALGSCSPLTRSRSPFGVLILPTEPFFLTL